MSDFSAAFPDDILMNVLGDTVVYIAENSVPVQIKAVIEFDVQRVGGDGYTIENRTEVDFLKASIPFKPKRGDSIVYRDVPYKVDAIEFANEAYYKVVVK